MHPPAGRPIPTANSKLLAPLSLLTGDDAIEAIVALPHKQRTLQDDGWHVCSGPKGRQCHPPASKDPIKGQQSGVQELMQPGTVWGQTLGPGRSALRRAPRCAPQALLTHMKSMAVWALTLL